MADFAGLFPALLISCALHLCFFWPRVMTSGAPHSPPLAARLKPVLATSTAAPIPVPASVPLRMTRAEPPRPSTNTIVSPTTAPPLPQTSAASAVPVAASQPVLALPTMGEGVDAAGLRLYRITLAQQLRALLSEAKFFAQNGHEHVQMVFQLSFAANGQLLALRETSGQVRAAEAEVLLAQIRNAATRLALPDTLRGQPMVIELVFER